MGANSLSGQRATTVVGANVKVIIGGTTVGFVTEFTVNIEMGNRPIYTVDSIIPAEFAPGPYKCTFSLSGTRILQTSLEESGWGVNYPGMNLSAPYTSIAIVERISGNAIVNIKTAIIDSVSTSIAAKGIATVNITGQGFVALSSAPQGTPGYDGTPAQLPP